MKIIFSRKGVDNAAGKCANALVGDRPVSIGAQTNCNALVSWEVQSKEAVGGISRPGDPTTDAGAMRNKVRGF